MSSVVSEACDFTTGLYNYLSDSTSVTVSGTTVKFSKKSTNISGEEKTRYVKFSPAFFKLICAELDNLIVCAQDSLHVERFFDQPRTASKLDGDVGRYYSLSVQEFGTRKPENFICFGFADEKKERVDGGINLKLDEAELLRDYSGKMTEVLNEKLETKKRKLDDIYGLPAEQKRSSDTTTTGTATTATGWDTGATRKPSPAVSVSGQKAGSSSGEPIPKKRKWIDNFFKVFNSGFMITVFRYVLNPQSQKMNKEQEEDSAEEDVEESSLDDVETAAVDKRRPMLPEYSQWYLQEGTARLSAKLNGINDSDFILEREPVHVSGLNELILYVARTVTLRLFWRIATRVCVVCNFQKTTRDIPQDGHCKQCDEKADDLYNIFSEATWQSLMAIEISDIVSEILAEMDLPCNRNLVWLVCKTVLINVVHRESIFDIHHVYGSPAWYADNIDSFLQIPLTSVRTDDEAALQFAQYY